LRTDLEQYLEEGEVTWNILFFSVGGVLAFWPITTGFRRRCTEPRRAISRVIFPRLPDSFFTITTCLNWISVEYFHSLETEAEVF
jgi:hypothetical protein